MKADIRRGVGCVFIVIKAETTEERTLLDIVAERRDWSIESKTSMPIGGLLQTTEISLSPQSPVEARP